MVRTLEEIRKQRGEGIHGFVLMVTGALPANHEDAVQICEMIRGLVDKTLSDIELATAGELEVNGMELRMEKSEVYIFEGLPNGR